MRKRGGFDRLDSAGVISYRAWLHSEDEHGQRILPTPRHFEGLKVRETRSYAPAPSTVRETIEERAEREGRIANAFAELTADERRVLVLQGKLVERHERRLTIAAGDLTHYLRDGFTLVPGSAQTIERQEMPTVDCVEVVGYELVQVEQLDYTGIAERLGVSVAKVHKLVKSANRKIRAFSR